MGQNTAADFITYTLLVAGILVLTRPNSQGPALVSNLTSGYANIVKSVTGQS